MVKKVSHVFSEIINYSKYLINFENNKPKQYIPPMKKFPPIPSNIKIKKFIYLDIFS